MGKTKCAQLSQSEAEVVWHIAAGFDRHQTAAFRGCSPEAVDKHRVNALRKLGLRGNVDLARLALRQGWITLDLQEGEPVANLDAVPGTVTLPDIGRAPTSLDVEQAAHAATKEELRIALDALAASRKVCHPGDQWARVRELRAAADLNDQPEPDGDPMTTETTTTPTRAAIHDDRLVWLDLETTGLDPYQDEILECAVIVTEADLTEVARFARVTDGARHADYARINPFVQKMHADNGLWLESLLSPTSAEALDGDLAEFVLAHAGGRAMLAGNSINFDAEFVRRALPRTHACLHHRQGNVSAMNEFARRRWPEVYASRPQGAAHRALPDVLGSIEQCRHYFQGLAPRAPAMPPISEDAAQGLRVLVCNAKHFANVGMPEAVAWISRCLVARDAAIAGVGP